MMENKFHKLNTKNSGHNVSLWAINTPGRHKVNASTIQLAAWASGMRWAGTTSGRYGQTKGPNVNPYIIIVKIIKTKIVRG